MRRLFQEKDVQPDRGAAPIAPDNAYQWMP
jgi:hypothetical protein